MKLVIQKIGSTIYAYRESERHHKATSNGRGTPMDPAKLDMQCDLSQYESFHMVFDIKKPKKKKRKKK